MATFLHDIIREVSGQLSTTLVPLTTGTDEDINEAVDHQGFGGWPALLYIIPQTGTYQIQPSQLVYVSYANIAMRFVDLVGESLNSKGARDIIEEQHAIATEFLQRLSKRAEVTAIPDFASLAGGGAPSFLEIIPASDAELDLPVAGVQVTFNIVIDPSLAQNNCD